MSNMSPEERNYLQNRANFALGRNGGFQERRFENMGVDLVTRLGYPYRGADFTLSAILNWEQSRPWDVVGDSGESMEGVMLRGALYDLGVLPRLRELDQTLTYSVSSGPALLMNDARGAIDRTFEIVELEATGKDVMTSELEKYRRADAYHHNLTSMRDEIQDKIAPREEKDEPTEEQLNILDGELSKLEVSLLEAGINAGIRQGALEDDMRNLTLAGESLSEITLCKSNPAKVTEVRERLRKKRKIVIKVEQAVAGLNEAARFLPQLVSMQTDMGGIIKVFTGPEPAIPSHLLRFLSISPQMNEATTVAMSEMLKLCYQKTDANGKALPDSLITVESGGEITRSLTAKKYTPEQRDRFFEVWEDVVQKRMQEKGVVGSVKLAEDAVSFSCFLMEVFTLGQTAYVRDRKTGKLIDEAHNGSAPSDGGTGSMYDRGGVDTVDKVHQLRDRKWSEALKGRSAPRPGVIRGLSQELLYSIFQYTEARQGEVALGMSVLEALVNRPGGYGIGDFINNLTTSGHFTYMLFAFRACQISDKLDQLINGRISAVKELGGGPEKLVEDMIDSLQGLGKAFQTIPFGRGAIEPWMAGSEKEELSKPAKELKRIEVTRNIINLFSDFYRGAVAGAPGFGGYEDNPDWRGVIDLLPHKVYERLVVYTNLLTPQQFFLALAMAKDVGVGNLGGVLTEPIVYSDDAESAALREILSQDPATSSESLINVVKAYGFEGKATSTEGINAAIRSLINKSATETEGKTVMASETLVKPAKKHNPKLTKPVKKI